MKTSSVATLAFLVLLFSVGFGCMQSHPQATPTPHPSLSATGQPTAALHSSPTPSVVVVSSPTAYNAGASSIADANNQFAFDLYAQLAKPGQNVFYSPFSISSALAITYEGARGQTSQEIQNVFHFPADDISRRNAYASIFSDINAGDGFSTLSTANALWVEKTFSLNPSYVDLASHSYGAYATNLDFQNDAEGSRQTINQWVEDKTKTRIQNLIPEGKVDSSTRLVITNAIYLNASWLIPFETQATADDNFTAGDGQNVTVKMMHQLDDFAYAETNDMQVLKLPYKGSKLSMIVLLPKSASVDPLAGMSQEQFAFIRKSLTSKQIELSLPRFYVAPAASFSLKTVLTQLGMPTAFTSQADFSGIDGRQDLSISDVLHKTFLNVTETGTEAAAATAVVIMDGSAGPCPNCPTPVPPIVFRADHPFGFIIQQDQTGNILFMGEVANPVAS